MLYTPSRTNKRSQRSFYSLGFCYPNWQKNKSNRQDVGVKGCKRKTCLQIDMSVPTNNILLDKECRKISKYTKLKMDVKKMWHLKNTTVAVIVGALGLIKKRTDRHIIRYGAV